MHIPACETEAIPVLSFKEALASAQKPHDTYDEKHWLYVPDRYEEYRYILGTVGEKPLICIGVNPSTAAPDALDNTLKSVERIAHGNGYDSFIMFNVYAQRATRPEDMEKQCNRFLHKENMEAFSYILSLTKKAPPSVWAAWGAVIETRQYLLDCVRDMIRIGEAYHARWYTAGARSKKAGHPHHPPYLPKTAVLEEFDIASYADLSERSRKP